jgi:hypothetical protein
MIELRRRGIQSSIPILPIEYQEVKYLENFYTGQYPYLELKNISRADVKFNIHVQLLPNGYGYSDLSQQMGFSDLVGILVGGNGKVYAVINGSTAGTPLTVDGLSLTVEIRYSENLIIINGVPYTTNARFQASGNFGVFRRLGRNYYMFGRIETIKQNLLDGNGYINRFVPCYRKADNTPGMYDTILNLFYANAGTGSFIVGPDIN